MNVKGCYTSKKGMPNYYIALDYVDEITRKRKRPWIYTDIPIKGNNVKRVKEKLKEVLTEYEVQKIDVCKNPLFNDFIVEWLETMKKSNSISITTYDSYKMTLKVHILPFFHALKVKDITPSHIQQYINQKSDKASPNTVKKHLANIHKCLQSAVEMNIIAFNPSDRVARIKSVKFKGAKHYNEKQIERLFDCSKDDPLELIILLTVFYGLRRSEVLGLKWDAIDFENNTIAIRHTVVKIDKITHMKDDTKNDASCSVVPMPNLIKTELIKWKEKQIANKFLQPNDYLDTDYVCTKIDGSNIQPDYVTKHFKKLLYKKNMPAIRFHDLRHSSASYLKYLGFDLKDIQVWLRHADIQTTMNLYTHLDMDAKRNIANSLNERLQAFSR